MNSVVADQGVAVWNVVDGAWSVREVYRRVEFFLDGVGLGDLVTARSLASVEDQVSPFDVSVERASAALLGDTAFEDWLDDASRVPLLMCQCGDLQCGALTVRLTRSDDTVQWTEWAWEDFDAHSGAVDLPAMTFALSEYVDAVKDAALLGGDDPTLLTRVRVRRPRPRWRDLWRVPDGREDERTNLGWLEAQAVTPNLAAAEGDYFEFLSDLDHAQSLIAGVGGQIERLSTANRANALQRLEAVLDSRHRRSLPADTLRAGRWFLTQLND